MKSRSASYLPSIDSIIFISIFAVLIAGVGNGLLGDGDTGYHIQAGKLITETLTIPSTDPFSHITPTLSWTAHEWLSEVIMFSLHHLTGLTGLAVFFAFLLAWTHQQLYRLLREHSSNILLIIPVTCLATAISASHWLARPHVFTLAITVYWYRELCRFQRSNYDRLTAFPFLMVLWINLHGGFIFGFLLLGSFLVGNLISVIWDQSRRASDSLAKTKRIATISLLCAIAILINPHGFEMLLFPFRFTSERFILDNVIEFSSPNFHDALPFKYMLFLILAGLCITAQRLGPIDSILFLLTTYMALYSVRHMSIFALITAPILVKLWQLDRAVPTRIKRFFEIRNRNLIAVEANSNGWLWPGILVTTIITLALTGNLRFEFDAKKFPVAAVEFIKRHTIQGNMFNGDEFGDYIIYTAWPRYKVFSDGRSDMYGEQYGREFFTVAHAQLGWEEVIQRHKITWSIFYTYSPLTGALKNHPDWHLVYSDKLATVFVKRTPGNEQLIKQFQDVKLALD